MTCLAGTSYIHTKCGKVNCMYHILGQEESKTHSSYIFPRMAVRYI